MATLSYERGASTLGQQIGFHRELDHVIDTAKATGAANEPVLRDRLVQAWIEREVMRMNGGADRHDRRAMEPGPRRDPDWHYAVHPRRAAADDPAAVRVIVNDASVLGWRAQTGQAHYAAAKAGVIALTRCAAAEAAPAGVRVNVSPSLAMHPFLSKVMDEQILAEMAGRETFGRGAEPWEVAAVIAFLASDYSSYMTGEIVSVSSEHP